MKVTKGEISVNSWTGKMTIDHDLEVVYPWLYSTYLIDDDIRESYAPGVKTAIYKVDFPDTKQGNQIIAGGTLELVLGELQKKEWGKNAVLPVAQ